MLCQPLVEERVVGRQQLGDAAGRRESGSRRTAASPRPSLRAGSRRTRDRAACRAPIRSACRARASAWRSRRPTPPREDREASGAPASRAQPDPSAVLDRGSEQLFVGNAAPQEEGQTRSEIEIGEAIQCLATRRACAATGGRVIRNKKLGAARTRSRPRWMPASKLSSRPWPVEAHQTSASDSGHRTAIRPRRDRRQNFLSTGLFRGCVFRRADEHSAARR